VPAEGSTSTGPTVSAVAASTGYSVQQIRDLERLGVIARARRSDNGYRRFSADHVRDLRAYRDLAAAVGPVEARRAMRTIRELPTDRAAALVCGLHVGLDRERARLLAARAALAAIRDEARTDAAAAPADAMTISELAQALGVRSSTLRFWETEDLVRPERVPTPSGTARRYPLAAIREARIVAALRSGGYRIPDVRAAIAAIRDLDDDGRTLAALEARRDDIAGRTLALMRAAATLAEIIEAD